MSAASRANGRYRRENTNMVEEDKQDRGVTMEVGKVYEKNLLS